MSNHNIIETLNEDIIAKRENRTFLYKLQGVIYNPSIVFIIFFIIMLGLFSKVTMQVGDDQFFAAMHLKYSLPEYLVMRYQTWSGRFLCDTLLYYFTGTAQFLWKWLCAVSITITAFIIYRFVIFARKMGEIEKTVFAYLSCFSVALISSTILDTSAFWITGALVYLVPFTLSLIAFVPFFYTLQNKDYFPKKMAFLYLIPAILTAVSDEQISLCFTSFSLLILIFLLTKKRRVPAVLWTIFISSLILQIISFTAPGNTNRMNAEINYWFPTFRQIGIYSRISLYLHFLLNTIINQWYLLLLLLWLITAILLLKNNSSGISRILAYISFFFAFLMGLRFIHPLDSDISQVFSNYYNKLFEFHYLTRSSLFLPSYFIPYMIWSTAILIIPISLFLIFKKTNYSLFYICIYLAAMASITIMTISPTIYASAGRTSFPSNMLLIFLILLLLRHDGLVKDFALPIMIIAMLKLLMFYSSWFIDGYQLSYGVLNTREIPFVVLGK